MSTLADALAIVEASPEHRVLRRIRMSYGGPPMAEGVERGEKFLRGLFIDTETTGLDHAKDKVIEFAAVPFTCDDKGAMVSVGVPFHTYIDPGRPIPPEMTKINGITDDMVAGKAFDAEAFAKFVAGFDPDHRQIDLAIAHHAEFDRAFCEGIWPGFVDMPWACSVEQVPWNEEGVEGRKLTYIASSLGYFYDAHNAINDCTAALFLLALRLPSGRTGLGRLLDKALQDSRRVWAINSPFETKDILKARGYRWNGGEDGRYKAWHKEVAVDALDAELAYLKAEIYRGGAGGRTSKVTPLTRFTVRG